jgi:thymidine kinase
MVGFLEVTFGPMFASKTSQLLSSINNYITFNQIHKKYHPKVLIINSKKDTRDELRQINNLTTHNKYKTYEFPSSVESRKVYNLSEISVDEIKKYDYLAVDEAQFFEDLKIFVDNCSSLDTYIHCSGLIADSEKKPFGQLYLLIPYADEVTQLKAFCTECRDWHKNAVFTKWVGEKEKSKQTEVGASGKYIPVCGKHY